MISILIPIFNYNTTPLVEIIHKQLELLHINYEIICVCDASTEFREKNKAINSYSNTQLILLKTNIGRSKIRNLLVEKSNYNWLLFLDADVLPQSDFFIKIYLDLIKNSSDKVFCGGLVYKNEYPEKEKCLRWIYGKKREQISVERRKQNPYQFVTGANILIHKSIFNTIKFNEAIVNYGYEDVLFIEDLKLKEIAILHAQNPVFHLGIERSLVFLNKTKEALENLHNLNSKGVLIGSNLKIIKFFKLLSNLKLIWFVSMLFKIFKRVLECNLLSKMPSLFLFDIYKIGYYCSVDLVKRGK
ncbi:glycosyltransferase [Lutibacter sp. A64]|uniref:glycosyltransferase family 2 protein n=1 Tax=Lutibacter sp. A64 TaxID=2918526 RepID=UPI001F066B58|nr:glycosyltransferase [Lutibacter sp. A64]UMB53963.1 glycosyltransferase [Lutibacter sp. A64]